MSKLSTFNEHFQKTITLRNELVPVGKTLENIISSNVLINDADRAPNLGLVERFNFGLLPRFNLSLVARFNFGLST